MRVTFASTTTQLAQSRRMVRIGWLMFVGASEAVATW
jgi:hypothetical protein